MATIEKLDSIAASKAAIKKAIQEKGVSCDDTLAEYPNRIKAIPTGAPTSEIDLGRVSIGNIGDSITFEVPSGRYILDIHGETQAPHEFYLYFIHENLDALGTQYQLLYMDADMYLAKWEEDENQTVTLTNLQQITITQ